MVRETNRLVGTAVLAATGVAAVGAADAQARPWCGETGTDCPVPQPPPPTGQDRDQGQQPRRPAPRDPNPPGAAPPQGTGSNSSVPTGHPTSGDGRDPGPTAPPAGPGRQGQGQGGERRSRPVRDRPDPPDTGTGDDATNPWRETYATPPPPGQGGARRDSQPVARNWKQLLTNPMRTGRDRETPPDTTEPEPDTAETPAQTRRRVARTMDRLREQAGDNQWSDLYLQPPRAPHRPAPPPRGLRGMDPTERDEGILNPVAAPMFTPAQREGARVRLERAAARKAHKALRRQVVGELDDDALPALLARPMQLRPRQVADPVLRDVLCATDGLAGCRRGQAIGRLELDLLREAGLITRGEDPDPDRRDSEWFKNRRREHIEQAAAELAARGLTRQSYPESPDFSWGGFGGAVLEHGKGLAITSFQTSPLGLATNPKEFFKENWNVAKGAGEGVKGLWDTGVMGWEMSAVGCKVDPEACQRRYDDLERMIDYASEDPEGFAKNLGLAVINYEDLEGGRYGEWIGNLAPDALLAAATYGSGTAASGTARTIRLLDDLPIPPRTRALLDALDAPSLRRVDVSPSALERLQDMLIRSSSGVGNPRYLPVRVSGGGAELRTWRELLRSPGVRRVYPVAETNVRNLRTPDFVAQGRLGRLERVESTIVTVGRGSGYRNSHTVRARDVDADAVAGAIRRKVGGAVTQFNSVLRLPGGRLVPQGGRLSLHLRRPGGHPDRASFDRAGEQALDAAQRGISRQREALWRAKVRNVDVNIGGRTVTYRLARKGGEIVVRPPRG